MIAIQLCSNTSSIKEKQSDLNFSAGVLNLTRKNSVVQSGTEISTLGRTCEGDK